MEESFYFALPLDKDAHQASYGIESYLTDLRDSKADTFDFDCAIIVFPTTNQIEYFRTVLKEDFDETISENSKAYDMIRRWIELKGVRVVSVTSECLELIGTRRTWNLTLRKENLPPWNLIFFKTDKEPIIVPPADFDDKLTVEYFNVC